jgi:hypothetical protein
MQDEGVAVRFAPSLRTTHDGYRHLGLSTTFLLQRFTGEVFETELDLPSQNAARLDATSTSKPG